MCCSSTFLLVFIVCLQNVWFVDGWFTSSGAGAGGSRTSGAVPRRSDSALRRAPNSEHMPARIQFENRTPRPLGVYFVSKTMDPSSDSLRARLLPGEQSAVLETFRLHQFRIRSLVDDGRRQAPDAPLGPRDDIAGDLLASDGVVGAVVVRQPGAFNVSVGGSVSPDHVVHVEVTGPSAWTKDPLVFDFQRADGAAAGANGGGGDAGPLAGAGHDDHDHALDSLDARASAALLVSVAQQKAGHRTLAGRRAREADRSGRNTGSEPAELSPNTYELRSRDFNQKLDSSVGSSSDPSSSQHPSSLDSGTPASTGSGQRVSPEAAFMEAQRRPAPGVRQGLLAVDRDATPDRQVDWLLEFWAPWCGAACERDEEGRRSLCAELGLPGLADESGSRIVRCGRVDCSRNLVLCLDYRVASLPRYILSRASPAGAHAVLRPSRPGVASAVELLAFVREPDSIASGAMPMVPASAQMAATAHDLLDAARKAHQSSEYFVAGAGGLPSDLPKFVSVPGEKANTGDDDDDTGDDSQISSGARTDGAGEMTEETESGDSEGSSWLSQKFAKLSKNFDRLRTFYNSYVDDLDRESMEELGALFRERDRLSGRKLRRLGDPDGVVSGEVELPFKGRDRERARRRRSKSPQAQKENESDGAKKSSTPEAPDSEAMPHGRNQPLTLEQLDKGRLEGWRVVERGILRDPAPPAPDSDGVRVCLDDLNPPVVPPLRQSGDSADDSNSSAEGADDDDDDDEGDVDGDGQDDSLPPGTGHPAGLFPCHGGPTQEWALLANGRLVSAHSGLCLVCSHGPRSHLHMDQMQRPVISEDGELLQPATGEIDPHEAGLTQQPCRGDEASDKSQAWLYDPASGMLGPLHHPGFCLSRRQSPDDSGPDHHPTQLMLTMCLDHDLGARWHFLPPAIAAAEDERARKEARTKAELAELLGDYNPSEDGGVGADSNDADRASLQPRQQNDGAASVRVSYESLWNGADALRQLSGGRDSTERGEQGSVDDGTMPPVVELDHPLEDGGVADVRPCEPARAGGDAGEGAGDQAAAADACEMRTFLRFQLSDAEYYMNLDEDKLASRSAGTLDDDDQETGYGGPGMAGRSRDWEVDWQDEQIDRNDDSTTSQGTGGGADVGGVGDEPLEEPDDVASETAFTVGGDADFDDPHAFQGLGNRRRDRLASAAYRAYAEWHRDMRQRLTGSQPAAACRDVRVVLWRPVAGLGRSAGALADAWRLAATTGRMLLLDWPPNAGHPWTFGLDAPSDGAAGVLHWDARGLSCWARPHDRKPHCRHPRHCNGTVTTAERAGGSAEQWINGGVGSDDTNFLIPLAEWPAIERPSATAMVNHATGQLPAFAVARVRGTHAPLWLRAEQRRAAVANMHWVPRLPGNAYLFRHLLRPSRAVAELSQTAARSLVENNGAPVFALVIRSGMGEAGSQDLPFLEPWDVELFFSCQRAMLEQYFESERRHIAEQAARRRADAPPSAAGTSPPVASQLLSRLNGLSVRESHAQLKSRAQNYRILFVSDTVQLYKKARRYYGEDRVVAMDKDGSVGAAHTLFGRIDTLRGRGAVLRSYAEFFMLEHADFALLTAWSSFGQAAAMRAALPRNRVAVINHSGCHDRSRVPRGCHEPRLPPQCLGGYVEVFDSRFDSQGEERAPPSFHSEL